MRRAEPEQGRPSRTPLFPVRTPLLTSRRHIDLQRVCSAMGSSRRVRQALRAR
ncbi:MULTISPECIES: putative leader peptide [Streptomyces]|uniref:Leader peptide n=1 Tax=Streptomyces griseosporeus TaxID=1910 RepID=A0ABV3KZA5_STRGS